MDLIGGDSNKRLFSIKHNEFPLRSAGVRGQVPTALERRFAVLRSGNDNTRLPRGRPPELGYHHWTAMPAVRPTIRRHLLEAE